MKLSDAFIAFAVFASVLEGSCSKGHRLRETMKNCLPCPPGWGATATCADDRSAECEKCVTGETYSSHSSRFSPCWQCSKCGVGLYEARKCVATRDTVCDDCTRIMFEPNLLRNDDFRQKCNYLLFRRYYKPREGLSLVGSRSTTEWRVPAD